jgi:WD40 repeat protein
VQAHTQVVRAVRLLSIGGRAVLVTGGDGGVRRWDPQTGHPDGDVLAPDRDVRAMAFAVIGHRPVLAAGTDDGIHRWDLFTGERIGLVIAAGEQIEAVAVATVDGVPMVLGGSADPNVRCWTMASEVPVALTPVTSYPVRSLTVAAARTRPTLVAGDDHGVSTLSLRSDRRVRRIRLGFSVTALAAETPSSLLIGSRRGLYHITMAEGE